MLIGGFLVIGRRVVAQGGSLAPPGVSFHLLIGLGALAMGMQNASLRRVGPFSVFTTHITGTLTRFGEACAELVFWVRERRRQQPPVSWRELGRFGRKEKKVHEVFFMGGLWLMFLLGAVSGAVLQRRFGLFSLLAPVAVILEIAIHDGLHPINPRGES